MQASHSSPSVSPTATVPLQGRQPALNMKTNVFSIVLLHVREDKREPEAFSGSFKQHKTEQALPLNQNKNFIQHCAAARSFLLTCLAQTVCLDKHILKRDKDSYPPSVALPSSLQKMQFFHSTTMIRKKHACGNSYFFHSFKETEALLEYDPLMYSVFVRCFATSG